MKMKIKRYNTIPKIVENWLGNRGVFVDDVHDPWYCKKGSQVVVVTYQGSTWLFIVNLEFDQVDVYYMNCSYAEIEADFPLKGFNWSDKNLIKIIKDLFENSVMEKLEETTW
jgi:hypothetical protein